MPNKYLNKAASWKAIHTAIKWKINGLGKDLVKKEAPKALNPKEGIHGAIDSLLKSEGRHPATIANFKNSVKNIEDRKNGLGKSASFKDALIGKALQVSKDSRNLHARNAKNSSGLKKMRETFSKKRFQKTLNKERVRTWGARAAVATPVAVGGYYLHRKNNRNDK